MTLRGLKPRRRFALAGVGSEKIEPGHRVVEEIERTEPQVGKRQQNAARLGAVEEALRA
jgi:hypothetical protein